MGVGKKIISFIKMEHHTDRKDIAGEMPFGDFGQLIALILFVIVWILDSFVFAFSTVLVQYDPFFLRLIFTGLFFGLAYYCSKTGMQIVFQEVRDPPELITRSIFSYSRHPIYLGVLLGYLGLLISTLSLLSLGLLVIIWIFYDILANFEERLLAKIYGKDYEKYEKIVPKWFSLLKFIPKTKKKE